MESTREHPDVVNSYLEKEREDGRIMGPLNLVDFPEVRISRFGVIPKKQPGSWHLILDLSSPEGSSINDGIGPDMSSLSYVSVDDATRLIASHGPGPALAKIDIKSAYRIIPIHPEDRHLLGMKWEGSLYLDACLPFGLRSAPKIFTAVADAAECSQPWTCSDCQ